MTLTHFSSGLQTYTTAFVGALTFLLSMFPSFSSIQNIRSTPTLFRLLVSTARPRGPARDGSRKSDLAEGIPSRRLRKSCEDSMARVEVLRLLGAVDSASSVDMGGAVGSAEAVVAAAAEPAAAGALLVCAIAVRVCESSIGVPRCLRHFRSTEASEHGSLYVPSADTKIRLSLSSDRWRCRCRVQCRGLHLRVVSGRVTSYSNPPRRQQRPARLALSAGSSGGGATMTMGR